MAAKKFRRRAEICLRFAARIGDPAIAQRLRLVASEYLARAEAIETAEASAVAERADTDTQKEE